MSTYRVRRFALALFTCILLVNTTRLAAAPKLVLFITIDQLRGDIPMRFKDRFGPDGFRMLMDRGAYFTNAHYRHSTTFTAVGHATLATGGNGFSHGMAGNDWYDFATHERVYCCEDARETIIGKPAKAHQGTSPRNLTSSTIGDELINASAQRSRVFSVSIKDRGAILPGGQYGKSFWYDSSAGRFITSTYYYNAYPQWVDAWNDGHHADKYRGKKWNLLNKRSTYLYADRDDQPWEKPYKTLGRTFPHELDGATDADFYSLLAFTPMGDELTLDFAKTLIKREKVGQTEGVTDMLAISFSVTDYIGHAFGPDSLEAEDNYLRLDRTLAELFAFVDQTVGLKDTLVVLSSDHGIDESPEARHARTCDAATLGKDFHKRSAEDELLEHTASDGHIELCCSAGRHFPEAFMATVNARLQERFKTDAKLVVAFWNPSLYLDLDAVAKLNIDVSVVEHVLAEEILRVPGFAFAVTRTDLLAGRVPDNPIMKKVQRAFHATRSGNVMIVQSPFWYLYPKATEFAAMHGSPYSYDTYVPVFFAGPRVAPQSIARLIGPEDIAPTIAQYLGIDPPSGSAGDVLPEVIDAPHPEK